LASQQAVKVVPLGSGFIDEGVSPGSNQAVTLALPRVLLLWDAPASSLSVGWARYVLEQRYGQPVTVVRPAALARIDLRRSDVLILPSGSYGTAIGGDLLRRIRDWISAGGTLITLGEATRWAASEATGLLETRPLVRPPVVENERPLGPQQPGAEIMDTYEKSIQPSRELPESVPGSILRVLLDEDHWLSSGTDLEIQVMVDGNRFLAPLKLDKGTNVGIYAGKERLLVSGLLWPGSAPTIARTPYLLHQPSGQGRVIAFSEDPNYRAYAEMTQFLFINALLLGTAF
jgi:hypothetical protein